MLVPRHSTGWSVAKLFWRVYCIQSTQRRKYTPGTYLRWFQLWHASNIPLKSKLVFLSTDFCHARHIMPLSNNCLENFPLTATAMFNHFGVHSSDMHIPFQRGTRMKYIEAIYIGYLRYASCIPEQYVLWVWGNQLSFPSIFSESPGKSYAISVLFGT